MFVRKQERLERGIEREKSKKKLFEETSIHNELKVKTRPIGISYRVMHGPLMKWLYAFVSLSDDDN